MWVSRRRARDSLAMPSCSRGCLRVGLLAGGVAECVAAVRQASISSGFVIETGFGVGGVSMGPPFSTAGRNNCAVTGCDVCVSSTAFDDAEGDALVGIGRLADAEMFAAGGAVCDKADTARSRLPESVICVESKFCRATMD